ncbi:hypothetical protein HS088_TW16G00332 [Tripterygium wilfordii]|uniref:Uncharacterized protein n=1 Tax=Tripterygium wilfordii TaxID=458696 RepID=A0A7J7CIP5_TRIWF|nr:hypothetical protein HS088_TW16G00332 [Tripterygium wilfordii]
MYSKRTGQMDEPGSGPIRTSDRLRRRPKVYGRTYLYNYYSPKIIRPRKTKTKTRTAASRIAQLLRPGNRPVRSSMLIIQLQPTFGVPPERGGLTLILKITLIVLDQMTKT